MKPILLIAIFSIIFTSCAPVKLSIPSAFSDKATPMSVKGLNGFSFNQKLTFGNYKTSKIKNGWTFTNENVNGTLGDVIESGLLKALFNIDKQSESTSQHKKYQYTLGDGKMTSELFCMESMKHKSATLNINNSWLGSVSATQNYHSYLLADIILHNGDKNETWKLLLSKDYNRSEDTTKHFFSMPDVEEKGYAIHGKDTIAIRSIRVKDMTAKSGKQFKYPVKIPAGYEFKIDNAVVAIIDTMSNTIWTYNDLDEQTKFILASISSAVMLRKTHMADEQAKTGF